MSLKSKKYHFQKYKIKSKQYSNPIKIPFLETKQFNTKIEHIEQLRLNQPNQDSSFQKKRSLKTSPFTKIKHIEQLSINQSNQNSIYPHQNESETEHQMKKRRKAHKLYLLALILQHN